MAVFALHAIQSSPSMLTEQLVYLSASGLAGIGRFLILRLFVFATGGDRKTPETTPAMPITPETPAARQIPAAAPAPAAPAFAGTTTITRPRRTPVHTGHRSPARANALTAILSPS